jgi:hypothetical protein
MNQTGDEFVQDQIIVIEEIEDMMEEARRNSNNKNEGNAFE